MQVPTQAPRRPARWHQLIGLLEAAPDGASQALVERSLGRALAPVRLLGPGHPLRELAGARAFLTLLDAVSTHLRGAERELHLGRLGACLSETQVGPRSALSRSLIAALGPRGFELDWLAPGLNARRNETHRATFLTRRELAEHALDLSGRLPLALARAGGVDTERSRLQGRALAQAAALARELRRLLAAWDRGCLFLAVEDLARHSIAPTVLAERPPPIELRPLVLEHISWLRGLLAKARGLGQGTSYPVRITLAGTAIRAETNLRRIELLGLRR